MISLILTRIKLLTRAGESFPVTCLRRHKYQNSDFAE